MKRRVGALSEKRKGLIHMRENQESQNHQVELWGLLSLSPPTPGQLLWWGEGDTGAVLLQGP